MGNRINLDVHTGVGITKPIKYLPIIVSDDEVLYYQDLGFKVVLMVYEEGDL